jgi:hypothetical protein
VSGPTVIIDGVEYTPKAGSQPRIGVAITTRNRPEILATALEQWRVFLPAGAILLVVDDASDQPVPDADHRFPERVGIARAKNRCLELLHAAGVEHMFLTDDDTYPLAGDWWKPYVDSPEPHLMHIFANDAGPALVANDGRHIAWTDPRGCFLYAHRSILDTVGGMDPVYGFWGHEHVDWSTRIHNAGLTSWRFADVVDSGRLIHCLDDTGRNVRSVADAERREAMKVNTPILEARVAAECSDYIEYRTQRDAVVTCWLRQPDPQSRGRVVTTPVDQVVAPLRASIQGADFVVLSDTGEGTETVALDGMNIYLARWALIWQWLRDHPEIRYAFAVDAPDVVMQTPPWEHLRPGRLYIGWEPKTLDNPWMRDNHKATILRDFIQANAGEQLLNAGVIGGERAVLMEFCHGVIRLVESNALARHKGSEIHDLGTDMGALNYVARTYFAGRLVTGSQVTTVFKAGEGNGWSWFKHK